MKLLPKDEVIKKKNNELVLEAQEGLRLAAKVDALRELRSKTEQETEEYLKASLSAATEQIQAAVQKRDSLLDEIGKMQKKLDAMLPEMETTRKGLREREIYLNEQQEKLSELEEKLKLEELDIFEAKEGAKKSLQIAELKESEASRREKRSSDTELAAKSSLERADKIEKAILEKKKVMEEVFSEREYEISQREHRIKEERKALEAEKRSFEQERIRFADRKAMLDRNLARLKNLRNDTGAEG